MLFSLFTRISVRMLFLIALMPLMLAFSTLPAAAETPATTLNTLLDKAQIQDMLVDYYSQLGGGHDFGTFYVADGILDVNGIVAQGKKAIEDLYKKSGEGLPRKGTFRMLLNNLKVNVNGDSATADLLWTGVNSETVKSAPQLIEQGREHDELVKQAGKWYFKKRVITSDGGLPPMYEKTYKKR